MAYQKGLVSVIIPTYKRPKLLLRAIDSVLRQTYVNLECIVVNDNLINDAYSQDLYQLLKKYEHDNRFMFVEQSKHINGAAARNYGINFAKGEFISFLDDDDYWSIDKLKYQVNFLNSHDNSWGAVGCLCKQENNGLLKSSSLPHKTGRILNEILCRKIGLGTGAVLIRRESLDDIGYFDESLIRHQDLQLFSQLASKYKIGLIKKHLFVIEESSTINRPNPDKLMEIKKAYYLSINSILNSLPSNIIVRMHAMHDFEYGYALFLAGYKKKGIEYSFHLFKSPIALLWAFERVFTRIISCVFRKHIYKKYSKGISY